MVRPVDIRIINEFANGTTDKFCTPLVNFYLTFSKEHWELVYDHAQLFYLPMSDKLGLPLFLPHIVWATPR